MNGQVLGAAPLSPRQLADPRAGRPAQYVVAAALAALTFFLNYRLMLEHFSGGGILLDGGWFAHLLGSGDPMLANPKSIADYSFYNNHVSPFLFLFGAPLVAFGLDRFAIFALHQGTMFALFTAAVSAMALAYARGTKAWMLLGVAGAVAVIGNMVWQIAGYPHIEIAMIALCSAGAVLLHTGHFRLAALPFALAVLVREDGGLFVGLFLVAAAILRMTSVTRWREALHPELIFAGLAAAAAVLIFWMKQSYFTEYATFTSNFSGDGWNHLTGAFIAERLAHLVTDPQLAITMAIVAVMALFSWKYLVHPVLISPLILAHLAAVRDVFGRFELHYIIPWVVIWIGMLIVASLRAREGQLKSKEAAVLLAFAMLCTAPAQGIFSSESSLWVLPVAAIGQVTDLGRLSAELEKAVGEAGEGACLSVGAVALVPDAVAPSQVIGPDSDLSRCLTIFLFQGDMDYSALKEAVPARGFELGESIGGRIEVYS